MDRWWQDFRFGARSLRRRPAMTALALLTMALCIGANTAIFSVVHGVLLEPLPFQRPDRLVVLYESAPKLGMPQMGCSPANFNDWRQRNRVFSSLSAYHRRHFTLTGHGEPVALTGAEVSGDFFRTLGVRPLAGRWFLPEDDRPQAEKTVVLSAGLWRRRFGGDAGVLHRRIVLDGVPYAVIGVAPATLQLPGASDLWAPLALDYAKERRGAHYLGTVARLAPGVKLAGAQAELSAIAAQLARQFPADDADWGVVVGGLQDLLVEDIRPALTVLQVAVWMVLLIGCVNVASLLLARIASRGREIAVRAALGAGRWRLARQVGAEGLILSCAGGALGLLVAWWGTPALIALDPDAIPRPEAIGLRAPVLAYALLVSAATGVACGLLPALSATGASLYGELRGGGRSIAGDGGGGRGRGRAARRILVVAQVALAVTLLVGAGLLLASFSRLQAVDAGFHAPGVITAQVTLPPARYRDLPRQVELFQRVLQRIGALPGVEHAAAIDALPLAGAYQYVEVAAEGRRHASPGEDHTGRGSIVSPDYFRALRIPLLAGRGFSERDDLGSPPVAIVSRFAASRLWPGQDAVGRRLTIGKLPGRPDALWWTVVGVAADVRDTDLATEPQVEVYFPQFQIGGARAALLARGAGDPWRLVASIRSAVRQIDPDLPLDRVRTLEEVVTAALAGNRVKTLLLSVFAGLAVGLAILGVYGLISQSVGERRHEISLRMALGSQRGDAVRLLVRQGMTLVGGGLAIGLAGAFGFSRLLQDQLYKVAAADRWTYGAVLALLAAVALLAAWLPARRAARADPIDALRHE